MPGPGTIVLIDTEGRPHEMPTEAAGAALDQGWRIETADDRLGRLSDQAKEADYGGVGGAIDAGLAAGLRGVTLGGSDVVARAIGGEGAAFDLRALREVNPGLSTGFEIGGSVLPAIVTGGAALPAGAAAAAARGIAGRAGTGALSRIGYTAAGGAVEGGLVGLGAGVTELALSEDPLSIERAAATLSSNALFGAATGGIAAGGLKGVEIGLGRAKAAVDDVMARRATRATATPEEAIRAGDLGGIDKRILDAAEKTELERIAKEQQPLREALTGDLDVSRREIRDSFQIRSAAAASDDANLREASAAFDRANLKLRAALDDKVGFAEDPLRSMRLVRTQGQALDDMRRAALEQERLWRADVDSAPARFRAAIEDISSRPTLAERNAVAKRIGFADYTGPFTPAGLDAAVERAIAQHSELTWGGAFKDALGSPSIVKLMPEIDALVASNRRLQAQLDELAKPPTSDLLTKIAEARAVLDTPKTPSTGGAIAAAASAVVPFAGPLGAAATSGWQAIGRLRKAGAAIATRVGKATSAFLDVSSKAAGKAAPVAPVLATKVLASVTYAPARTTRKATKQPTDLPSLYKARTDEIKDQVHVAPDGSYRMRPDARARMATRFDGIRPADPKLADELEEAGARRLEYLASIMPRLPDYGTVQIGPDRRRVPELQMRSWARSAAAVEDPAGALERLATGKFMPEDAHALRGVAPELLADAVNQIVPRLSELRATLPYARRLALSIMTGVPVEPAMTPGVLRVIQGMYAAEPGTAGGTQAPTAQPQFGSVKADKGTPAQQRQGDEA